MAFELWTIPGGQYGEGTTVNGAILQAVGMAVMHNPRLNVTILEPGETYNLTNPEVVESHGLVQAVAVLTGNLALWYECSNADRSAWSDDEQEGLLFADTSVLPEDSRFAAVFVSTMSDQASLWSAKLFRLVRHVEETPSWTALLAKRYRA